MMIFTVMTLGFYFMVTGEQKIAASDRDYTVAFYGAEAGIEKLSADLAAFFVSHSSPTPAQIDALAGPANQPNIPNVSYPAGGYTIAYETNPDGSLKSSTTVIGGSGPLQGLQGIMTPFILTVIARGPNNTEVKLTREVQEIAVPVFQYGIFSENDLSFFAGPNFNFGGRVNTNGTLYVAEGQGNTLTMSERVTAYEEVIRTQLSNGYPTAGISGWQAYTGNVNIVTTPGSTRHLAMNEGSYDPITGTHNPNWPTISLSTYNGNIRTGATGAKKLNLALALAGATPYEIIRRPPPGEDTTSSTSRARFFNQASLRILLSDQSSVLLPPYTATTNPPVPLDATLTSTLAPPYGTSSPNSFGYVVDACRPPIAISPGGPGGSSPYQLSNFHSPMGTPLLGGYIKIEMQLADGSWQDVTMEILNQGIQKENSCTRVTGQTYYPILHMQKLMPTSLRSSPAATAGSQIPYDYIPINMYDTREGALRDSWTDNRIYLNGVMNIVELNVNNLQRWFAGSIGTSGTQALNNSGYIVYFSDRRGNQDASGNETGEFGNEDIINPSVANGMPNGVLDTAENVNGSTDISGNPTLDTYGAVPHPPAGSTSPLDSTATPQTYISSAKAQLNRVIFFRRALRLVEGRLGKLPPLAHANCSNLLAGGFAVAAENPVYILGDYNADSTGSPVIGFNDVSGRCHVPASVAGDAVTLLSNSWQDSTSFSYPTNVSNRVASNTYYRTGVIAGKHLSFPRPTWTPLPAQDFGTDGGAHNFLRFLENWSNKSLYYRGSIVSFYTSRQATGVYKCCNIVYSPPSRVLNFDTDFQDISKLPPGTPRFTDVNALAFKQAILPQQ